MSRVAGTVVGGDRLGLTGFDVMLLADRGCAVVDRGVTGRGGRFALLDPRPEPGRELFVRVVAADDNVLLEEGPVAVEPGGTIVLALQIPEDRLRDAVPVAAPLEVDAGSVLEDDVAALVDAAIVGLEPQGGPEQERLLDIVRRASAPTERVAPLVEYAGRAIDGDEIGGAWLREDLERFAPEPLLADDLPFGLGRPLDLPWPLPRPRGSCGIKPVGFAMLVAGVVQIADSRDDALRLLGGLEQCLEGVRALELLAARAERALAGDARGLRSALEWLDTHTPAGLPARRMPFPVLEPCEIRRMICVHDVWLYVGAKKFEQPGPKYVITSISPADACPGDTLTLTGTGFGTVPGRVCFLGAAGGGCTDATTWTDTVITATVHPAASGGRVTLDIVERTGKLCGHVFEIKRPGTGIEFTGGRAQIAALTVAGRQQGICIAPNTSVPVAWQATPAGNTAVRLVVSSPQGVLLDVSGLPAVGSTAFTTPAVNAPSSFTVTLEVSNACGADAQTVNGLIDVMPRLNIEGVEVTQGIQTFRRAGVPDNSLSTITGKDTIVRVYVSADRDGFSNDEVRVHGTLRVDGLTLEPINGVTPTNPSGATYSVIARPAAKIDRAQTGHTLNFRIPAYMCHGTRSLFIYLVAGACGGRAVIESRLMYWSWSAENALPVRFVRIRDNRPAPRGTGTIPTEGEARFTLQRAFDLLPTTPTDVAPAPFFATYDTAREFTEFTIVDPFGTAITLDDGPGLLSDLRGIHTGADFLYAMIGFPRDQRWIGLTAPVFRGWGDGLTCIAPIYVLGYGAGRERLRAAHELGHSLGLGHNSILLEDVAFDPYWNRAIPATNHDFMSYDTPDDNWIYGANWTALQATI
jgi:hypothetical protein